MEYSSTEPRLSAYLHTRACRAGTPLAGNFELTARCNFDCKMCYVHLTAEEQRRRGRELTGGRVARHRRRGAQPRDAVPAAHGR